MTRNELTYLGLYFLVGLLPYFIIVLVIEVVLSFLSAENISVHFPTVIHRTILLANALGFLTLLNKQRSRPFYLKKEERITPKINLFMNVQLYLLAFVILLLGADRLCVLLFDTALVTGERAGLLVFDCIVAAVFAFTVFYKHTKGWGFDR